MVRFHDRHDLTREVKYARIGKRGDDMDEIEKIECKSCGDELLEDSSLDLGNNSRGCYDCYSYCERCEEYALSDNCNSVSGQTWCDDCRMDGAFWCSRCDEFYSSNRVGSHYFEGDDYCEDCIGEVAEWCENCDEWEESSCDGSIPFIHDYSYKPTPNFIGTPKHGLYLGWELEADAPSRNREEAAEFAAPILEGLAYLKQDGSVPNGIEIVTHPIAHSKVRELDVYWDTIEKLRTDYGMRSWDVNAFECGLHIHLSRAGFSGGAHIHRFLRLIYGNAEMMARFAGRTTRYATFQDVWKFDEFGKPYRTFSDKMKGRGGERNSAVNTYPDYTIELRFFRGTMRKEGILACLDLAQAGVEYTRELRAKDVMMGALDWEHFYDYVERNNGLYPDAYNRMPKVTTINLKNRQTLEA